MEPGFYADMSTECYLSDMLRGLPEGMNPPDLPSLNSTLAKVILDACPARARYEHPRLNPQLDTTKTSRAMEIGNVSHAILLGRGKSFEVLEYDSRRTKAAKAATMAATDAGKISILAPDYQHACAMATAARDQLREIDRYAFDSEYGYAEFLIYARDPVGAMTRALVDWYGDRHPNGVTCWDYKTTEGSANPETLRWHVNRQGWAVQAAFQERIIETLKGQLAGKVAFRFLVQEQQPPYLASAVELEPGLMLLARKHVAIAIGLWQRCWTTDQWPGYPTELRKIAAVPSMEGSWLEREYNPEFAAILASDPYLNIPTTPGGVLPIDGPVAEWASPERPKRRPGRPRKTDEERAQRALQRDDGAIGRKVDL